MNKKLILEWVNKADFCEEFNLVQIAKYPLTLSDDEYNENLT